MHQPHHRPGAPAFLNTADQIIAFINEHQQSHRSVGRIGGECACGWTAPDNTVITVGDHAAAALIHDLAERLSTGWTDTDGTEFNWPDLVEHHQNQLDAAHHRMDTYQFRLAQLFEVAQTMRQAAKVVDDFIAERDAESAYIVAIHRSGTLWEIHIPGVGTTQAQTPAEFETVTRDYLAALGRNANARLDITWHRGTTTDYLTWESNTTTTTTSHDTTEPTNPPDHEENPTPTPSSTNTIPPGDRPISLTRPLP